MRLTRRQDGFTLPAVLGMMMVALVFALGAYQAAAGGTKSSGASRDGKQAYAAAEAGLNWYLSRLVFDNAFWTKCTAVASPSAPVNDAWNGAGPDPRQWRTIPDSPASAPAEYTVELLPANGAPACSRSDPNGTMIDATTRSFRIRSTGRFDGVKRSLVASFRRARFLDFLYLTEYETTDPLNYANPSGSTAQNCAGKLRAQRSGLGCSEIQFAAGDVINGPLHSNDSLLICGGATFGRSRSDAIETSAASPGWVRSPNSGCGASPNFRGSFRTSTGTIQMPATDTALTDAVLPAYRFTGSQDITLDGSADTITVKDLGTQTTRTLAWPSNGLVYVAARGSCTAASPRQVVYQGAGAESTDCANAYVSGTYGKDITVASAKDVIVDGNVRRVADSDAVAGLIAGRFARIYHPVTTFATDSNGRCTGDDAGASGGWPAALRNPRVDAAILAVNNSFTVDNYTCGDDDLGSLTVSGGIAQSYRGAVGSTGSSSLGASTGYVKNYVYDDRFVYRNPPFFLEPASATWRIVRAAEQLPAR